MRLVLVLRRLQVVLQHKLYHEVSRRQLLVGATPAYPRLALLRGSASRPSSTY